MSFGQIFRTAHAAFHRSGTLAYRIAHTVIWTAIIVSLVFVVAEVIMLDAGQEIPRWLFILDRIVLWFFVVELVFRVATYHPPMVDLFEGSAVWRLRTHLLGRLRYLFTPFMLVDLLAVMALVPALRGLRVLRLLRLFRGVSFFRYSNPIRGLLRTFQENALLYAATFTFLLSVVNIGGISLFLVESRVNPGLESVSDGVWWALVTLTTVGFGDITPMTALGRVIGGAVMVLGMFTLALFAGIVGSTLLRVMLSLREDQFRMSTYTDHFVICGYEPGTRLLLDSLLAEMPTRDRELVVFGQGERPAGVPPEFVWISGEPTKESELDKVRLEYARALIVVGSRHISPAHADANTILIAFTARSYMRHRADARRRNIPLYIVAEILEPENVEHARVSGADEVIETTRVGFDLVAHAALVHGSGHVMTEVAAAGAHSVFIQDSGVDEPTAFGEIFRDLRETHGVVALGVRDPGDGDVIVNPPDTRLVQPNDEIVYLAEAPISDEARKHEGGNT